VTAVAALRHYARTRRALTVLAEGTQEHAYAVNDLIDAWEAIPVQLLWVARHVDRHTYRQTGAVMYAPVYRTRLAGIPAALRRYAAAERALCENSITEYAAGTDEETPEYLHANNEAAAAHASVPWCLLWLTELISRRIVRELDYFNRTGQPREAGSPVACWLGWLLVTAAVAAGACLITSAVTQPATCTAPSPVPSVFTPAPVAAPQVTP
jgi:hypothetical protein